MSAGLGRAFGRVGAGVSLTSVQVRGYFHQNLEARIYNLNELKLEFVDVISNMFSRSRNNEPMACCIPFKPH